jgi:nucleotide-binding universal stress UspA family protein
MAKKSDARTRILVAFNASRRDFHALELAANLAARDQAELLAVFVEDINLFNLAELPFAKEISRASAVERELDNLRLARTQKSRIEQIQQTLDQLIERLGIPVSLRIIRGHFVQAVLSAADEVDILFFCHREEPVETLTNWPKTAYSKARRQAGRPVWTIFDGSAESKKALLMAADLATLEPCELCIALPAKTDEELDVLRRKASQTLAGSSLFPRFTVIYPYDAPNLLRLLRQSNCRLLVVNRDAGETVKAITETAACPIVLV